MKKPARVGDRGEVEKRGRLWMFEIRFARPPYRYLRRMTATDISYMKRANFTCQTEWQTVTLKFESSSLGFFISLIRDSPIGGCTIEANRVFIGLCRDIIQRVNGDNKTDI